MARDSLRIIETKYLIGRRETKTTRSTKPGRAVARCIENMEDNVYGADYAEVWNLETGKVYAQVKYHKNGDISIWKAKRRPDLLTRLETE